MNTKCCTDCKIQKPLGDFYTQRCHSQGKMAYCKQCFNARCQRRWRERKLSAIAYLGGQCADCGLQPKHSHYAVFEFHHLDPMQKDADWSKLRLKSQANIENELTKCVLLCANCPRVRHALLHTERE